jgi:ribosomal subunit interface protein
MNITIKGTHYELTEKSRSLIEEKFERLHKFAGDDPTALLECSIEESLQVERAGAKFKADANLSLNGKLFHAEAMGETLEAAVDEVRDELAREVRRAHGKARHFLRRGGAAVKSFLRGFND